MKTRLLIILLLTTGVNAAFAQWTKQTSSTKNNLLDIAFAGPDLGYAVGANGTVLKTLNGGTDWVAVNSPDVVDITSVTVIDSAEVFVTTANTKGKPAVYRSTDGGITWKNLLKDNRNFYINKAPGKKLFSISSKIYESDNEGASWQSRADLNSTSTFTHISFADINHGMVAGNISGFVTYSAMFERSRNGGKNWYASDPFSFPNANAYTALDELSADSVFMFTNFYKGFNPGDSSQLVLLYNFKLQNPFGDSEWHFKSKIIGTNFNDRINDCRFFKTGIAYSTGEKGIIYNSPNGGKKWQREYAGTAPIHSLYMVSETIGYAAGDSGLILKREPAANIEVIQTQAANVKTYPNPANDHTTFSFNISKAQTLAVKVFDEQGNIVFMQAAKFYNTGANQISMPTVNWQRGIYHINIISNGKIIGADKLIVAH